MNYPRLEELETRTLLSTTLLGSSLNMKPSDLLDPPVTPGVAPLTPGEMRAAYNLGSIQFLSGGTTIKGDGTGQTIAIVDAYNDPTIVADLAQFDTVFGLPAPPSFTVLNQTGGTIANQTGNPTSPRNTPYNSWAGEISLDVEWSHVIAPGANIVLFEATSSSNSNLGTAVKTAATASTYTSLGIPAASVVSNSYGSADSSRAASSDEAEDTQIYAPISNANKVSLVFSSGDSGTAEFPSTSPYVLGVGGTEVSLKIGPFGASWSGEVPYNDTHTVTTSGVVDYGSSGGGTSAFESEPSYQLNYGISNSSNHREAPDISMSGGLESGVYITDSFDFNHDGYPATTLGIEFGTSLAAPMWAGLVSIVNQGRELANGGVANPIGNIQEAVYALPTSDFHDITTGSNGLTGSNLHSAGPGYDEVTGIGSPIGNKLIPDLVNFTGTGPVTFTRTVPAIDADAADQLDDVDTFTFATEHTGTGELSTVFSAAQVTSVESIMATSGLNAHGLATSQTVIASQPMAQIERIDANPAATALPIAGTTNLEGFRGLVGDALAGTQSDVAPAEFSLPADNGTLQAAPKAFAPAVSTAVAQDLCAPEVAPAKVESVSDAVFADDSSVQASAGRVEAPAVVIAGEETHTVDAAVLAGLALVLGGSWNAMAREQETRKYPALRS